MQPSPVQNQNTAKKGEEKKNLSIVIVKYRAANDPELAGSDPQSGDNFNAGLAEVLTDKDLETMFNKKPNSKDFNWKTVEYIQTCVKDQVGIGKHMIVNFFAPLNETNDKTANQEVSYDYKHMPDELTLLQNE